MKKNIVLAVLLAIIAFRVFAQENNPGSGEFGVSVSASAGLVIPLGEFSESSELGAGFEAGVELNNILFENASIKAALGMSFNSLYIDFSDKYYIMRYSLLFGYQFPLGSRFLITPRLGTGIIDHVLIADDVTHYFDPMVKLDIDLSFNITRDLIVYLRPTEKPLLSSNCLKKAGILGVYLGASWFF